MRNYQVLEDRLIRHLDEIGVKKLDFIIGTHVHSDHIGGADEILNRYQVGKFYLKNIQMIESQQSGGYGIIFSIMIML